jgi:hypothetical protein
VRLERTAPTRWAWLLPAAALILFARPSASTPADDGVPSGTIAFFAIGSGCPDGWQAASNASGRVLVAANDGNVVGQRVGDPLGDQEDRTHSHSYVAKATIPTRNIIALNGSNNQAAQAGTLEVDGEAASSSSELPFVQLIVCKKP